jgi:hypothetical protein
MKRMQEEAEQERKASPVYKNPEQFIWFWEPIEDLWRTPVSRAVWCPNNWAHQSSDHRYILKDIFRPPRLV